MKITLILWPTNITSENPVKGDHLKHVCTWTFFIIVLLLLYIKKNLKLGD